MIKKATETYELSELIRELERQHPIWPSTFSTCECKRHSGRGGGRCHECIEEALAEKIGKPLAWELHKSLMQYQRIKSEILYGEQNA